MTAWLFGNMLWAAATMLIVLLARRPVAALVGAGPAYALWMLPALRIALPPLPAPAPETASWLFPLALAVAVDEPAYALTPDGGPAPWVPILIAAWAGGTAAFLLWQWLRYRQFLARLSLTSRSLGAYRGLPLVESGAVEGPVAVGLLDRRIVVPVGFAARFSPEEQRLALEHEAIHHRRGDIWCNLAALLILALNWFNPVAWLAFRAFRADQELACDAAVAARASPSERQDYARAIVKSASRDGMIAACPLNPAEQLKRRLKMMSKHRRNALRTFGGAAAVLAFGAVSVSLGSPGAAHPHPEGDGERLRHVVIVERQPGEAGNGEPMMRRFRVERGEHGDVVLPERCRDGEPLANIDESRGEQRTRILLCGSGDGPPAERADRLQRARERIAQHAHLDAEHREHVLAAIDREIARLRSE